MSPRPHTPFPPLVSADDRQKLLLVTTRRMVQSQTTIDELKREIAQMERAIGQWEEYDPRRESMLFIMAKTQKWLAAEVETHSAHHSRYRQLFPAGSTAHLSA